MTDLTTLLTADYEHHYNGLTFGADHPVAVTATTGLRGYVARVADRERDRGHGAARLPSWTTAREIRLRLEVVGQPDECETLLDTVEAAFGPRVTGVLPLVSRIPGRPFDIVHWCYPTGMPYEVTAGQEFLRAVVVPLRAPDPRIYSASAESVGVPLFTGAAGSGINGPIVNGPINLAAVVLQQTTVVNLGRDDAWPVIYFRADTGTATSVTMTNVTTGEAVTVTTTMSAGQLLTFDAGAAAGVTDTRVVDLAGANRWGSWVAPFTSLRLQPGSNVLQFTQAGATAASAWVDYSHTSLS